MKTNSVSARTILVGFLAAAVVLYVLVGVVGVSEVVAALATADRLTVGAVFAVALCWMTAWSYTLYLVFGVLDVSASRRRATLVYLNVLFANQVAPFSVGGGEPIAALFVSRATRANYETALLSVVSTDVINYLPAPAFAFLGVLYVGATTTVGQQLEVVAGTMLGISALLAVGGGLAWRYRRWLEVRAVGALVALQRVTVRVVPSVRLPSPADLQARIGTFVDGLERVAADRRVLALGIGSSALGWLLQATALWLSLSAVGAGVRPAIPVLVVSLVTVTDLVPLPGGIGSVDAALVVLLVALTGLPAATATAAALVFRSATLLFPIVLGGATVAALQLTRTSSA
ncbi:MULTISPECIES: lysylphosphatidylglycerol synthase transmembrane domain-containing protein [Halorussus]|uniref:lysylphosphatidylglycerol synthase transmembrane domain-containing protein n=1 Tax=Halorussus TaxID=1070314 RepID=UPI00209D557B|nr:lysylphosphatidylglycerol synthase transmembrane domain-containing protein [Halorussus vallis]USZ75534.1 flippase-like domain-containing protein [Halorussus vallis]